MCKSDSRGHKKKCYTVALELFFPTPQKYLGFITERKTSADVKNTTRVLLSCYANKKTPKKEGRLRVNDTNYTQVLSLDL